MSVCLWLEHKPNTIVDKVDVLDHNDLVPADSVHLVKVCLVVVMLPLTAELECPPQSEAEVGSRITL